MINCIKYPVLRLLNVVRNFPMRSRLFPEIQKQVTNKERNCNSISRLIHSVEFEASIRVVPIIMVG